MFSVRHEFVNEWRSNGAMAQCPYRYPSRPTASRSSSTTGGDGSSGSSHGQVRRATAIRGLHRGTVSQLRTGHHRRMEVLETSSPSNARTRNPGPIRCLRTRERLQRT
jgi:hypothetical protein